MPARLLRKLGLSEYGADEVLLATAVCAASAYALYALCPWSALAVLPPWLLLVWFFRDPERAAAGGACDYLAPADGRVTDIGEAAAPEFMGGKALRVGIFLSPLDVHVNRSPCDGTVVHVLYRAGAFLPAYDRRASERNESLELGLLTSDGLRIVVKQIAGVLARRVVCAVEQGRALARGARYGMIKFGSRTELYVPADAGFEAAVAVGQKVRGGQTVLLRRNPRPAGPAASQ